MENGLRLVLPTIEYRERALDYIREFREHESEVHGSGSLDYYALASTYEAWLDKLREDIDVANMPAVRVPALTYFCVREADGRVVGMVNIRLADGAIVPREAGHVGYSVRPTERRKHYATWMLAEAVRVCRAMGIRDVYVTCTAGNAASAGTIMNCGGRLEESFFSDHYGETIERYVIPISAT